MVATRVLDPTMATKSLAEYLHSYRMQHTHPGTKLTHMIGIPMILASLPITPVNPPLGIGLFAGGWALQLVGHYVFEKNDPAFFADRAQLLVGAIWSMLEWAEVFGLHIDLPEPSAEEAVAA